MEELRSLADLLDLQGVDLQIDHLLDERQSLPELEGYRRTHREVEVIAGELADANTELRELTLALDRNSGELTLVEAKAAQEENRLYAGGLSARDAGYLRREVEMLRRKVSDMEDEVLAVMEAREKQEALVEDLTGRLATITGEERRLEGVITEAWRKIDAEIAIKEERKATIIPLIDGELLELYEEMRSTKEGAVVGRLAEDGVCGACHLKLSAAEVAQAVKQDPPRCMYCRAILVP